MSDRSEKRLRKESNTPMFKAMVRDEHGCACVNCGSYENVEYHHIVPISLGGTNAISNVVPLCHKCHKAAHCGRHLSHYSDHSNGGRKRRVPDEEFYRICNLWLDGQIGNLKRAEMLGISVNTQRGQFKEWLSERGLKSIRNQLDFVMTVAMSDLLHSGRVVGKATRLDGTTFEIYFNDTGLNDDVEYPVLNMRREKVGSTTFGNFKKEVAAARRAVRRAEEERQWNPERAQQKQAAAKILEKEFSDLSGQLFEDDGAMRRVMGASFVRRAV